MERCDSAFSMAIVRRYLVDGYFEIQPDFLFVLFGDYVKERDVYFESAAVNRWLNGLLPVNSDIGRFYHFSMLEFAFEFMEKFRYDNGMKRMLKEIDSLLKDASVSTPYRRTPLKAFQAKAEKKPENAIKLMKEAIALMPEINEENAELAATVNLNLANLYMPGQKAKLFKQHMLTGMAIMEKYNLVGEDKRWVRAVTIVAFIYDPDEFEGGVVALLTEERFFFKRKKNASAALKELGGVLKSMVYMRMAAGHKEEAAWGAVRLLHPVGE